MSQNCKFHHLLEICAHFLLIICFIWIFFPIFFFTLRLVFAQRSAQNATFSQHFRQTDNIFYHAFVRDTKHESSVKPNQSARPPLLPLWLPSFDPEKSRVRGQQGASSVEGPPCWPVPVSRAVLGRPIPIGLQSTQRRWAAMELWRSSSGTSRSQRPASTPARPLMPTRRSLPKKSALKLLVILTLFIDLFIITLFYFIFIKNNNFINNEFTKF